MRHEVVILPALPRHVSRLMDINRRCFHSRGEHYPRHFFEEQLDQWREACHVAVDAGKVIGYVLGRVREGKGYIVSLVVLPRYRRYGIASMLMDEVHEAFARFYHREKCYLHVREGNNKALSFYKKLGYRVHDRHANYYKAEKKGQDDEDALVMRKQLRRPHRHHYRRRPSYDYDSYYGDYSYSY